MYHTTSFFVRKTKQKNPGYCISLIPIHTLFLSSTPLKSRCALWLIACLSGLSAWTSWCLLWICVCLESSSRCTFHLIAVKTEPSSAEGFPRPCCLHSLSTSWQVRFLGEIFKDVLQLVTNLTQAHFLALFWCGKSTTCYSSHEMGPFPSLVLCWPFITLFLWEHFSFGSAK